MLHSASKAFFHLLARIDPLKALASRYGMRHPSSFARRFIAGESIEEAIAAAREVEGRGFLQTLDYLGESVTSLAAADAATREYLRIIEAVVASGIGRNLSLKLTQLGLDVDRASAIDNLRRIFDSADGFFVRIDMESSAYTDLTLDVFETLWNRGHHNLGVAIQAALKRSEADVARVNALGGRVRLVKGAYKEPPDIAHARKDDVDGAFVRLMRLLLDSGQYPAIATHDPKMIDATLAHAEARKLPPSRYEFQMLYGVRRDLQRALSADGYRVRVYVPFGREWFPYFMRRLGERPANVAFVIRAMLRDRGNG